MTLSISTIVAQLISIYEMLIVVYVLMSWFRPSGVLWDVYRFLGRLCDPYLDLFRRIVPIIGGGLDISPIVALLVLDYLVQPLLATILRMLGV